MLGPVCRMQQISLTDKLGLDVGIRYCSDESRGLVSMTRLTTRIYKPPIPFLFRDSTARTQQTHRTASDPKATIHYDFTVDIMAYATYAVGFKSGGFNIGGLQPPFAHRRCTIMKGASRRNSSITASGPTLPPSTIIKNLRSQHR